LITIILIAALACFGYSAYSLGHYAWESWKTQKNIDKLALEINTDADADIDADADEPTDEELAAMMMSKYGSLYEKNNDFIGWLTVEDTNINNPVMYTPDDPQHYLRKNFDGDYDIGGMLFIDYRCTVNPASTNIIIYGHHMKNGTMFGPLMDFQDADYLKEHSTITFDTLYRPGTYKIFASFQSAAYDDDSDVFRYYDFINANTKEELNAFLENIKALSLYYDEDNAPVFGDQILTLSTCDYYTTNGRYAVLAKRISN
jgi:sortase B